jgi:2-succinyl-5-enolpyruvyl-6-hydroxy-3-cyclohexene-1-carboxylate synthase
VEEEQKMFTFQKYSRPAERSLAFFAAVFRKTSSIIANGSLMRGSAVAAANPAMAEAAP